MLIENIDHFQILPPPDLEVVEVMGRGYLDGAGPLFRVGILIRDNRDFTPHQRQENRFADQVLVALIIGMNRDAGVPQHGLGPRRGDHHEAPLLAFYGIFEMPEVAIGFNLLHLKIGDRRQQFRVPVDEALVLVDQPFAVEIDEHLEHGFAHAVIHGEALAGPVAGFAEAALLLGDQAARFSLPVPDPLNKFFPAHCTAVGLAVLHELALDHHLRGDAGMIRAWLPQHVAPAHALKADQDILQCVIERVAHMQRARDIGRRQHDAIGLCSGRNPARPAAGKRSRLFPGGVDSLFQFGGLISLVEHMLESTGEDRGQ
ncbi:hypothetical protein BMS3Bbin10_02745 [bacterium BMS3Bbin10]|nr:hypothetical protein BMS3Bbin10_02745 [bacterium BMS3Bbin10]